MLAYEPYLSEAISAEPESGTYAWMGTTKVREHSIVMK